jgi:hypothetical protein
LVEDGRMRTLTAFVVMALLVASFVGAGTPTTWTLLGDEGDKVGGALHTCAGGVTLIAGIPALLGTADSEFPALLGSSAPVVLARLSFTIVTIKPAESGGWIHTATASPESGRKIEALVRARKDFAITVRDPIGGETYSLGFTASKLKSCE